MLQERQNARERFAKSLSERNLSDFPFRGAHHEMGSEPTSELIVENFRRGRTVSIQDMMVGAKYQTN